MTSVTASRYRKPDAAGDLAGSGRHRLQGLQRLIHGRASGLEQTLPRIRERHRPRGSREESDPEARLELPDGLAQGGGRYAEIPRRRGEAAASRDRDERVQGVERSEGYVELFYATSPLSDRSSSRGAPDSARPAPRCSRRRRRSRGRRRASTGGRLRRGSPRADSASSSPGSARSTASARAATPARSAQASRSSASRPA